MAREERPKALFLSHGGGECGKAAGGQRRSICAPSAKLQPAQLGSNLPTDLQVFVGISPRYTVDSACEPDDAALFTGGKLTSNSADGPGFFMKEPLGGHSQMNADSSAAKWYRTFARKWPRPAAIIIISAHWEERTAVRVMSKAEHPLFFDYYGFPDYTYKLKYKCRGHPELAKKIMRVIKEGGIDVKAEEQRGYDHGVFIPLKLMYPEADIPIVQVSLLAGLSPQKHALLGTALAKLAENDDVLLIGSGQATHNVRNLSAALARKEEAFADWLKETVTAPGISRENRRHRLIEWESSAPHGRVAHPREEHLIPLHVVEGYMNFAPARVLYDEYVPGAMSLACFGYWKPNQDSGHVEG